MKKKQSQQSHSVTSLVNSNQSSYASQNQSKLSLAQQRGISEHANFEEQVSHYYSKDFKKTSLLVTIYPALCALLLLIVAFFIFTNKI